jgi:hypothetical protein
MTRRSNSEITYDVTEPEALLGDVARIARQAEAEAEAQGEEDQTKRWRRLRRVLAEAEDELDRLQRPGAGKVIEGKAEKAEKAEPAAEESDAA